MNVAVTMGSISRLAGGLFSSVKGFSQNISTSNSGVKCQVFALKDKFSEEDRSRWSPIETKLFSPIGLGAMGLSFSLFNSVKNFSPDILHQHGLWMLYSLSSPSHGKKIISPHGMLDSWALQNSAYKKKIVNWMFENRNLQHATCIHALCDKEYIAIREYGLENPVCIIPNGVNPVVKKYPQLDSSIQQKKTLLYLGRIHPKKGLSNLLIAWQMLGAEFHKEWRLVIAGWGEGGYPEELVSKTKSMNITDSVCFPGPLYGVEKQSAFENADCFVLPSYSEGLPMVVLEAWAYGLPVLMTAECNIPEGFSHGAALEIKPSTENIAAVLTQFLSFGPADMDAIGRCGIALVREKYDWRLIGQKMYSVYNWMLGRESAPDFIRFD